MARRVGWYQLPFSRQPFYGTVPDGVDTIDAPVIASQLAEQPPKSAGKPAWIEFARPLGVDVDELTKAEIIEAVEKLIDAGEDEPPILADVAGVDLGSDADQVGPGEDHDDEGT